MTTTNTFIDTDTVTNSNIQSPDFTLLNMEIHEYIKEYPVETQIDIFQYLNELDEINRKGYSIAYDHLKTSFNIVRSNGFKKWKSKS
jgi:hypothetical protein